MPRVGETLRSSLGFLPKRLSAAWVRLVFHARFIVRPAAMARRAGRSLKQVKGNPPKRAGRALTAIVPFYGTAALLAPFLRHYRELGVEQFVFLDVSDARNLADLLHGEEDVAVWQPSPSRPMRDGLHWLNYLRNIYCRGGWCLSVEPSDFLVFYRSETRHLRDLIDLMDTENRKQAYGVVLELYGDVKATALPEVPGDPLASLRYYDAVGYNTREGGRFGSITTQGGPQRRTLFAEEPRRAPPINRIPLVKWRPKSAYMASTRVLMPRLANTPHARWHTSPTVCLLRYAMLESERALAIASNLESSSLIKDGHSLSYPGLLVLRDRRLMHNASATFRTSRDLVDCGLLSPGQWF